MPITPFLRGQAFDPELVNAMGAALSKTCDALGLTGRNDPITTLVAEKIIELAERGLRNPTAIHRMAMTELESNSRLTTKITVLPPNPARHRSEQNEGTPGGTGSVRDKKEVFHPVVRSGSVVEMLDVLVRTAMQQTEGEARAAFYIADAEGAALHHVTGMPQAYAQHVDGFPIGPQSLACGLAAGIGRAIITRDVIEDPRWTPWLWLAKEFDYRACWSFPVGTSAGKILGTFAMYYKEPREATQRDLDLAATLTSAASLIIMNGPHPVVQ